MGYVAKTILRIKPLNKMLLRLFEDQGIIFTSSADKMTYMAFPYVLKKSWEEDEWEVCSMEDLPENNDTQDLEKAFFEQMYPNRKEESQ